MCSGLTFNSCSFSTQANKIIEHRRKYERKREEREIKDRKERVKKAREEHEKAQRVSVWCKNRVENKNFKIVSQRKHFLKTLHRRRRLDKQQEEVASQVSQVREGIWVHEMS